MSVLFLIIVVAAPAISQEDGGQATASSLRVLLGPLYLTPNGLGNGTATGPCGPSSSATAVTEPEAYAFTMPFASGGNGTLPGPKRWHLVDPVSFSVTLGSPNGAPANSGANGITVRAVISGTNGTAMGELDVPALTSPQPVSFTIALENATTPVQGDGDLTLTVSLEQTSPNPGSNVVVACGSELAQFAVFRGQPGAQDLDGDQIPDAEDADRDGDGALNSAEPGSCAFGTIGAFADNGAVQPGRDSDGDGFNDDVECSAVPASNPTDRFAIPPQHRTLMQILLPWIVLLVILGLIAAVVWVFWKFGRTAMVTIASQPELFIPPGTKGKYEVAVRNLAKKGEPRTYQLAVAGMPDGWDAKLNTDHVTLEPEGGATNQQSVWLEVESPAHNEPESAVVTVKATPLNKAGRKDTFKLGGKAETITSINVPPGSKVPVKRGGKIQSATPSEEAEAPAAGAAPLTLVALGADEAAAKKLGAQGIADSEQLRTADAAVLAKKTKIAEPTLTTWQQVADLVRLGMTPQQAATLAGIGIGSIPQLADAEPKELAPKAGVDEKTAKGWVKAAGKWRKKHKDEMPATPAAAAPPSAGAPATVPAAAAAAASAPAKPQLQVGGLRHEPPAFRQGEAVKSIVSVANNGRDKNTIKLSLYVNDGLADVQTVTVKPGKSQDVKFKWTAQEKNKLNIRGEIVPT